MPLSSTILILCALSKTSSAQANPTEGPATEGPATEGPSTEGPATEGPSTEGPATEGPATNEPSSNSNTCEPSVDNDEYCKCPVPITLPSGEIEISVCGDATFVIPKGSIPCSGDTLQPGAVCPSKDDTTILACKDRDNIFSFLYGKKTGTCKAPEDAECLLLNTGVYGCVFAGNANTVNTCLNAIPVSDNYKVDADGKVVTAANGYPVPTQEAIESGKTNTANFPSPVTLSNADDKSSASNTSIYSFTTTSVLAIVLLAML